MTFDHSLAPFAVKRLKLTCVATRVLSFVLCALLGSLSRNARADDAEIRSHLIELGAEISAHPQQPGIQVSVNANAWRGSLDDLDLITRLPNVRSLVYVRDCLIGGVPDKVQFWDVQPSLFSHWVRAAVATRPKEIEISDPYLTDAELRPLLDGDWGLESLVICSLKITPALFAPAPNLKSLSEFAMQDSSSGRYQATNFNDEMVAGLIQSSPRLRKLHLAATSVTHEGLRHLAELTDLQELGLHQTAISPEGFAAISKISGLTIVSLHSCKDPVEKESIQALSKLPKLETLELMLSQLGPDAGSALADFSTLRNLKLNYTPLDKRAVQAIGKLHGLQSLSMPSARLREDDLAELAGLKDLRELNCTSSFISGASLKALAGCTKLLSLQLSTRLKSREEAAPLENLANLKHLEIDVEGSCLQSVARLTNLESLKLYWIQDVSKEEILQLAALSKLTSLDLGSTDLSGGRLAFLKRLPNLEHVRLSQTKLTDDDAVFLGALKKCEYLDLGNNNKIGDATLKIIGNLPAVKDLSLIDTQITDAGMVHLANLKNLSTITLWGTSINAAGLSHLEKLPRLQEVYLSSEELGNEELGNKALIALAGFEHLENVVAWHGKLDDDGVEKFFKQSKHPPHALDARYTRVTKAKADEIHKRFPFVRIDVDEK